LIFSHRVIPLNEQFVKKDAIAVLHLKRIQQQTTGSSNILYYEGMKGEHFFQSEWHQFISDINNNRYNKKPGNVFLHSNLYRQVQIAYAIPRIIALVTISDGETCNVFPTDLHGQADNEHYIISLRTGGKALEQVEAAGKVVITELDYTAYKMVYALGKNHMQPLKPRSDFPFSTFLSNSFKWPIPQQAIACKEMLLVDSFTHGIHKILLFKIIADQQFTPQAATLAHIHNSYASWRYKNKLTGNYLLR
jgi:hypothetical protein